MALIKISSIPGIDQYSSHIKLFLDEYKVSISEAISKFDSRVEGSKGQAIQAFLDKLNSLQEEVYFTFPSEVAAFYGTLYKYMSDVKDEGFSEVAWSSDKGEADIENLLSVNQKTSISDVDTEVQAALNKAGDALGSFPTTTGNIYADAEIGLTQAVSNRQSTHDSLSTAHAWFVSKLQELIPNFTNLKEVLINAKFIMTIPPTKVLDYIDRGKLTVDNMYYLDAIKTSDDYRILDAILTDGDKFVEMGSVDPSNISNEMMYLVYEVLYKELPITEEGKDNTQNLDNLQRFLNAVLSQQKGDVSTYMTKLVIAGDSMAYVLGNSAVNMMPELPENATAEQIEQYFSQTQELSPTLSIIRANLDRASLLTGLFETVYIREMGTSYRVRGKDDVYEASFEISDLKLSRNGNALSFTEYEVFTKYGGRYYGGQKSLTVEQHANENSVQREGNKAQIEALHKERSQALLKLGMSLASAGVGSYASIGAKVLTQVVASSVDFVTTSSASNGIKLAGSGNGMLPEDYQKHGNFIRDALSSGVGTIETFQRIQSQIEALHTENKAIFFDAGGRSMTVDGNPYKASYAMNYDLSAILNLNDLNENGLRGYAARTLYEGGYRGDDLVREVNKFNTYLADSELVGAYNEEVKAYLQGLDATSLSDFDNIDEMQNGLKAFVENKGVIKLGVGEDDKPVIEYTNNYEGSVEDANKAYFNALVGEG